MNRKKKTLLLSGCSLFLLFLFAWFSVGDTNARYLSRFSGELSFSAKPLPTVLIDEQPHSTASYVLKTSADSWSPSAGEKIFSFDLSLEDPGSEETFRVRVFVEGENSSQLQMALTLGDQRYNDSQGDYLGEKTPFYAQYQTIGWYYCFMENSKEVSCLLDSQSSKKTVTISLYNVDEIPPIWVCIDRISA